MLYLGIFVVVTLMWVVISKLIFPHKVTWKEAAIQLGVSVLLSAIVFGFSYYGNINDSETINGEVKEKVRDNDSHQESYSCNCVTHCSGGKTKTCSTSCKTCWRTVYTVDWFLKSTIGNISIDSEKSYSMSIWLTPDPELYTKAFVGEPCAKKGFFVNYVKGASKSLFNTSNYSLNLQDAVPLYPELTGIYQINSVLNVGTKVDTKPWQEMLRDKLKTLSSSKQVNIILIFTNSLDPMYRYKVEKEWTGGKKNDIVVIIGTDNSRSIWVDGFTFGLSQGNYLLLSKIKDQLSNKPLDKEYFINTITNEVSKGFTRKSMKDFEYLASEIRPEDSTIIILMIIQLILNISFTVVNVRYDLLKESY